MAQGNIGVVVGFGLALAGGAGAATAQVSGLQYIVEFEEPGDMAGVGQEFGLDTAFSCQTCSIQVAADPSFPARSGVHQVVGLDFDVTVLDPFNNAWPGIGAYVTGQQAVFADFYSYDYGLGQNVKLFTRQTSPNGPNQFLAAGFGAPLNLTFVHFYSDAAFTLDDLTIGRTDVLPAVPEPSGWALMILGCGATGAALRRRRAVFA